MIGLVNVGQPIRFQINLHAVQKANIKISSQLLKLARIVDDRVHPSSRLRSIARTYSSPSSSPWMVSVVVHQTAA
jgi:hypothetical protein